MVFSKMNISNYYWYFSGVLTPKFCDDVIAYANEQKEVMARTGGYGDRELNKQEVLDLKRKRNSDLVWLNDTWIYKEIHPYVHQANRMAGWNFDWERSESCQFTKYKLNQYYDWHCDSWDKPYVEEGPTKGKIRKLSVTVTLTDPKEYKGGELEFDFRNEDPDKKPNIRTCTEILPKGSLVIFPSFVWHRVKPVTKGERNSLVIWNLGYPFK